MKEFIIWVVGVIVGLVFGVFLGALNVELSNVDEMSHARQNVACSSNGGVHEYSSVFQLICKDGVTHTKEDWQELHGEKILIELEKVQKEIENEKLN